jgi:hypothetical protein
MCRESHAATIVGPTTNLDLQTLLGRDGAPIRLAMKAYQQNPQRDPHFVQSQLSEKPITGQL